MKFTDAVVVTLKGYFNAGDQPTEAQFAALIDAIQEGIEEHDHDATGDGDGVNIFTGNLGIGADPGVYRHLYVRDVAVNTVDPYYGAYFIHKKTAGVTDENDALSGLQVSIEFDQVGGIISHLDGVGGMASLTNGEVGQGGTPRNLRGLVFSVVQSGGTVWGDVMGANPAIALTGGTVGRDVFGLNVAVDIDAAFTSIGGDVVGLRLWIDADTDPTGEVYMIYLEEHDGVDFGIYQAGTAVNYLGGRLGVNVVAPLAMGHFDQAVADAAIPVIILDQADSSEGYINFIGGARAVITGATNSDLSVRVEYGGTVYRLALYADA